MAGQEELPEFGGIDGEIGDAVVVLKWGMGCCVQHRQTVAAEAAGAMADLKRKVR